MNPRSLVVFGSLLGLGMAGCSFDPALLNARLCDTDLECPTDQLCVAGACQAVENVVDTGLDIGDVDLGDGVNGTCGSSEPFCEGLVAVRCDGEQETRVSCLEPSECTTASGCYCLAGACLPRVCTPGSTRCNDDTVEVCDDDGAGYVESETCGETEVCLTGACLPRDCDANTVECVGDRLVSCGSDGLIGAVTDCSAEGGFCSDEGDQPQCIDRICEPGSRICEDQRVLECDERGAGYAAVETCTGTDVCFEGVCSDRICEPGAVRCSDIFTISECGPSGTTETTTPCGDGNYCASSISGVVTCEPQVCDPGTVRCLEGGESRQECNVQGSDYLAPEPCGNGNFCQAGVCVPWVCVPGSANCAGDFSRTVCDARGTAQSTVDCADGTYCAGADGAAACLDQVCEPDTRRCSGLTTPQVCDARGSALVNQTNCASDESCRDGLCVERVCDPGTRRCADSTAAAVCAADGLSETNQLCGADQYCDAGVCQDRVCTPDANTCFDGFTVARCNALGSTSTNTRCASNEFCASGTCQTQVCSPNSRVCEGDSVRLCNANGSATTVESCGTNQSCVSGTCVDRTCTPNVRTCANLQTVSICNAAGTSTSTQACGSGTFCSGGTCVAQVCTPNASTCIDTTTRGVCDAAGSVQTSVPCGTTEFCSAGACVPRICVPGTLDCSGNTARRCNTTGSGYVNTACTSAQFCDAGTCRAQVCTPSSVTCLDADTVQSCNANGSAATATDCSSTQYCEAGQCRNRICTPGARQCNGATVQECNALGSAFVTIQTCTGACTAGVCENVPRCGDGILQVGRGEQCDDGNTNTCDACNNCQIRNVGVLAANTARTGGGTWVPATSNYTLEAWIRASDAGLIAGINDSATATDWAALGLNGEGRLFLAQRLGGAANTATTITGPALVDNQWHHVAGVRFGSNSLMLFVDGRLVAIDARDVGLDSLDGAGQLYVGSIGTTFRSAAGQIDEVRFSNSVRYAAAFTPLPRLATDGSTIAHYRFDTASLSTLVDVNGTRNLTMSNLGVAAESCLGAAASSSCGDGQAAPWEACDGNTGCGTDCLRTCRDGERRGPTGQCYRNENTSRNWGAQRNRCNEVGSELITISSVAENRWLQLVGGIGNDFWIGLNDIATEGTFVWSSGQTPGFTNWADGEPNNFSGGEDCAAYDEGNSQWNDVTCATNVRAICEADR